MRRADRLFQIVQYLRARRLTTAAQLAEWLGVSERTVYRDVRDLSVSGIPVDGAAGVGYRIDRRFELTPLMFTSDEVEALVVGLRMVEAFAGPALGMATRSALCKVTLALPQDRRGEIERSRVFAPRPLLSDPVLGGRFEDLRQAIDVHRKVEIAYLNEEQQSSRRIVRPLALHFWGKIWTLAAWCELRQDFRTFRLDRIQEFTATGSLFEEEPDKSLEAFLRVVSCRKESIPESSSSFPAFSAGSGREIK